MSKIYGFNELLGLAGMENADMYLLLSFFLSLRSLLISFLMQSSLLVKMECKTSFQKLMLRSEWC